MILCMHPFIIMHLTPKQLLPEAKNDDLEMRTFVYSLLAAEGTLHSQEVKLGHVLLYTLA